MEYSIPITNIARDNESISVLKTLCNDQNYPYELNGQLFCFSTPVGKWQIDLSSAPYIVYHINLVHTPNNTTSFHRQPRLFLSLLDTFSYIQRHDQNLIWHNLTREEPSSADM